ncbi:MAG TPA: CHAT domain-containing protein [Steroidobacteraceae bacterium]|nr:CHAT domain-containing protein [Steroidobacteraceae bacterium]
MTSSPIIHFRARHGAVLAVCWILLLLAACGHASRDVEIILPETRFEIATNAPAIIERGLAAGAYSVVLAEDEIDTRTSLMLADRAIVLEDPLERHGRQIAHFVLPADATVRIEVESTDHRTKSGGSVVEIARWTRAINADPTDAEQGDSAYSDAIVAYAKDKEQSFKDADAALEAAAYRYRKANDSRAEATTLYARGRLAYLVAGDWLAAERSARAARDVAVDLDDRVAVARANMLIASARIERAGELAGDVQRDQRTELLRTADSLLESSATIFSKSALPIDLAAALTFQGVGRWTAREAGPARAAFEKAVQVANEANDAFSEARALGNLAWLDYERADIHAAAAEYERLLQLVERDRQPDLYASLVSNYGVCLILLGNLERALDLHTEALQVFSSRGNETLRARELLAIGKVHLRIGNTGRALETLETSLRQMRLLSDELGVTTALGLAGTAAGLQGDHQKSLRYHREMLERTDEPRMAARARVLIASDLRLLGQLDQADFELKLAVESAADGARADILVERGRLSKARHDGLAAEQHFKAADLLYAKLGLDFPRIVTNTELSRIYLAADRADAALEAANRAIELVGRVRLDSVSPELRARFVAGQYAPFEARIAALLRTGGDGPDVWQALVTAEIVRARSLSALLSGSDNRTGAAYTEIDRLRDQLTAQQFRLEARLQTFDSSDSQSLLLRRDIAETRASIDAAFQMPANKDSHDAGPVALSIQALRGKLAKNSSILYFFVGDESSFAWLLTAASIRHISLPGRHGLERSVKDFVESSRKQLDSRRGNLQLHYSDPTLLQLVALLESEKGGTLLIVPDGPLHSMPFAALETKASGHDSSILLDRFQIAYASSLKLVLTASTFAKSSNEGLVAVIADPVYATDDSRMLVADDHTGSDRLALRKGKTSRFVRLPFSAIEADEVVAALAPRQALKLEGFDANVNRLSRLPYDRLAVLHFATHAIARSDSPGLSALYLSSVSRDGAPAPKDYLSSNDIIRLGMRANLVVLSACATGDGSELSGEGVLGLTHSFLANGSNAVVASLWPIEDSATARLMGEFYRAYAKSNNPITALQHAQQQLRRKPRADSASVWSSFIVRTNFPQ